MKRKVCHWLDPTGPRQQNTSVFAAQFYFSAFSPPVRGSWTTNCRTRTTLCLFLLFMEGRSLYPHILTSSRPPPPSTSTTRHLAGRCRCVSPHRDIWGDWCRSTRMCGNSETLPKKKKEFCGCLWLFSAGWTGQSQEALAVLVNTITQWVCKPVTGKDKITPRLHDVQSTKIPHSPSLCSSELIKGRFGFFVHPNLNDIFLHFPTATQVSLIFY